MWNQIKRISPLIAILVGSAWTVGQPDPGCAAPLSYQRLAQLKDADSFYTNLGKAAVERAEYHRAVRLLTSAIGKGGRAEAFKYRSLAYEQLGQDEKASADVERYIGLEPRDPWGYTKRGTHHSLAARHDTALAQYLRAVKLDASYAPAHFGLGIVYTALERHEDAVQEFRNVLGLEPRNTDAVMNLGVALMLSGHPSQARAALSRALQAESDPRWKSRIQGWIASLPATGGSDGTDPVEDSLGRGSGNSPVPAGSGHATDDRAKEQDGTTARVPGTREIGDASASRSGPDEPQEVSPQQGPIVLTGRWNTSYQGIEIGVTIKQTGEAVTGVMNVDGPFVGSNSYPFEGTVKGGILRGGSREGHTFEGRVYETGQVVGKFEIKGGPTVPVRFNVKPGNAQPGKSGH
ncbi:MAG: tetratricopeptide repeat protein [Pseudomonadota bacterium]